MLIERKNKLYVFVYTLSEKCEQTKIMPLNILVSANVVLLLWSRFEEKNATIASV